MPAVDRRFCEGLADTLDLFERDGTPVMAGLSRESVREFRRDLRRLRARFEEGSASPAGPDGQLRDIAADLDGLATRVQDAQDRLASRQTPIPARRRGGSMPLRRWSSSAGASWRRSRKRLKNGGQIFSSSPTRIRTIVDDIVSAIELDFLFDRERQLFAIGYNVTEGRRDTTYYDALASEARLASFLAIALSYVAQEHWFKLGRLMTSVGHQRALVSWSASMFEYLMPLLIMRSFPRTLLNETYEAVVNRHIEYAKGLDVPWGISESAYNVQDAAANYQYRAFGVPGIGLKRGLADDLVVAPYATLLAATLRPREVLENLEHLASEGALGSLGYYEAIDYTKDRLEPGQRRAIVRTYMAHHQGMSLVALNNCINDNIMQSRFHADPHVQSAELLLQERSPHLVPLDHPPEEHKVEDASGRVAHAIVRRYATPHTLTPRAHLLSNGSLSVMVTNAGAGYTRWRDVAVTRWREDSTVDGWGSFCYLRDLENGTILVLGLSAERTGDRQLRGDLCARSRRHPAPRRRHRDDHRNCRVARRRCGDPARLA